MAAGPGGAPRDAFLLFDWQGRSEGEGTGHLSGGAFTRCGLMFGMVDNR